MKRGVAILALLVFVTIGGGVITAGLGFNVPTIIQSSDPAASAFEATPSQALYFVLWIGFVIVNVIGAGATLAFLLWWGNREVTIAKATPTRSELEAQNAQSLPEST